MRFVDPFDCAADDGVMIIGKRVYVGITLLYIIAFDYKQRNHHCSN